MSDPFRQALATRANKTFHEWLGLAKAIVIDLVQGLIDAGHSVGIVPIFTGWMEVESFEKKQKSWAETRR